ncbi:MAG: cytochrome C oxidase subunit IV family protein [Anaerolineae bacterium]|nr:cytochrome C oxidase subunit IV family protein [Anaerolineae bacterium]
MGVFVALALVTFIEVALAVIDPSWVVGPLVMLSTIKVLLVVGFFMHLFYDSKWYAFLFTFAMPFASLIIVILALAA